MRHETVAGDENHALVVHKTVLAERERAERERERERERESGERERRERAERERRERAERERERESGERERERKETGGLEAPCESSLSCDCLLRALDLQLPNGPLKAVHGLLYRAKELVVQLEVVLGLAVLTTFSCTFDREAAKDC